MSVLIGVIFFSGLLSAVGPGPRRRAFWFYYLKYAEALKTACLAKLSIEFYESMLYDALPCRIGELVRLFGSSLVVIQFCGYCIIPLAFGSIFF
jgi:hypothetical protein